LVEVTTPGAIALTCNQIAVVLRPVGDWPRRSRWSWRRRRHQARARACHYLPALLPTLSPGAAPSAPCDQRFPCQRGAELVLEEDGFVVPPGYVGAAGHPHGRLVVAAARRAADHVVACEGQQRVVATVTPHGIRGRLVQCDGSGVHHDSALVRWRERGVAMVASVLGHTQVQQQLVMTVATTSEWYRQVDKRGEPACASCARLAADAPAAHRGGG
jgi:hypothetical protein